MSKKIDRRSAIKATAAGFGAIIVSDHLAVTAHSEPPFGPGFPELESLTTGEWWNETASQGPVIAAEKVKGRAKQKAKSKSAGPPAAPKMNVARDKVVAFALYTCQNGILKLSAQLFPLLPDEPKSVRLEVAIDGTWTEIGRADVLYPGWDAHFRVEGWKNDRDVPYRVRHGSSAVFEGVFRHDPVEKPVIVVGNLSCNSSRTTGSRAEIVENLKRLDPDLLFFAGDQTYRHTEHTAGWIEFGLQFRDVIRDRPTICIPDDHDVGHGNVWGESGKRSTIPGDADGGYRYPVEYVNQVQRQQSWHLPDPVDPAPVERGIGVYFTRLTLGGIDFAILEDRKFKTGPAGKIPQLGPRPDHVNDSKYDPKSIDLPNLELLGPRQEAFLERWTRDWTSAEMKCVLSQTAFCGAVHIHGTPDNRLLADLDCNGWPQTKRTKALKIIRRAWATHLCGDQHLAAVVKHGIVAFGDGPYGFTSPAIVNTIYARWWHPADEKPGPNSVPGSPLPWTGDFRDGLGNRISMLAYANPENLDDEKKRADGFGIARFDKRNQSVTFECWPRFADSNQGESTQFPGWPITFEAQANDGRKVFGHLPELVFENVTNPVVEVIEESTGETVYCVRVRGNAIRPRVYSAGKYTVKTGRDKPDGVTIDGLEIVAERAAESRRVIL